MIRALVCWLVVRVALVIVTLARVIVRRLMGIQASRLLREAELDLDMTARNLKVWL